jgi:hypothetical protein
MASLEISQSETQDVPVESSAGHISVESKSIQTSQDNVESKIIQTNEEIIRSSEANPKSLKSTSPPLRSAMPPPPPLYNSNHSWMWKSHIQEDAGGEIEMSDEKANVEEDSFLFEKFRNVEIPRGEEAWVENAKVDEYLFEEEEKEEEEDVNEAENEMYEPEYANQEYEDADEELDEDERVIQNLDDTVPSDHLKRYFKF